MRASSIRSRFLSTLPSAGVGALLALMLFRQDLDLVALIGIILLIGIVTKNGIMMVDFALDAERTRGMNSTEAIYEACLLRFRPHPHDDHGRIARRTAARDGQWHRLGAAPATGNRHGRRAAVEPGADAVHDACDLCFL